MKNPLQWAFQKLSASLEREVEVFETFREHERRSKRKRPSNRSISLEGLVFKLTGASRMPASRRLIIGTYLAIMVFWALVFLETLSIVVLREFNYQLLSGIATMITFIAGTYFGRLG